MHTSPPYSTSMCILSSNRMQGVNMCSGSLRSRVSCSLRSLCHVPYTMLWLAFAVAATSGRAHRAQHRRQAQARRSRDGRGYTNASSPASSDLSTLPAVGFCRDTRKEPGQCESGLLGWWSTADLEQCAARCRLCAGTNRASAWGSGPSFTVILQPLGPSSLSTSHTYTNTQSHPDPITRPLLLTLTLT